MNQELEFISYKRNKDLTALKLQVQNCKLCPLHLNRTQTVFGYGDLNAKLMIIGEAPGAKEDEIGRPFVGPSGNLLTKMLQSIGVDREKIYITNIVKCRPEDNQNPKPEEIKSCNNYLQMQIQAINPKLILCLGKFAAQTILQSKKSITDLRGQVFDTNYGNVVVSYHPAYLLRSPLKKRQSYLDLQKIAKTINKI